MAVALLRASRRLLSLDTARRARILETKIPERCIMTSRVRLEKVLEDLKRNPYFDKYAQKIAKLQETSPEEFLSKIEEKEQKEREINEKRAQEQKFQQASKAKPTLEPGLQRKEARLEDIMKIEMIQDKTREEIIEIWQQYHVQKDCISGIMTPAQFDTMFERGKLHPTFLLPLPRSEGYEFIVCQFHGTEVHMTPLLWYQVHKENAPECLTMTHYTELRDDKELVLMRGEFDTKSINVQEAQCLANELQLYYVTENPKRIQLLESFTKNPDEFKHMDLIANVETITLDLDTKATSAST